VQKDLKKLVAYSSISHMGFVLLGVAALRVVSLGGAVLQMFSHGLITALLFLLVGLVYDHAHSRQIPDLGGLAKRMPLIATFWVLAGLASLGLPAMSGFVDEFLVIVGSFPVSWLATVLGMAGIVLTAGYMLYMIQRVFFGPPRGAAATGATGSHKIGDASPLELVSLVGLTLLVIAVGLYPTLVMPVISSGILPVATKLGG
jgi:NADH-quinone oxidoreductase subunit M